MNDIAMLFQEHLNIAFLLLIQQTFILFCGLSCLQP